MLVFRTKKKGKKKLELSCVVLLQAHPHNYPQVYHLMALKIAFSSTSNHHGSFSAFKFLLQILFGEISFLEKCWEESEKRKKNEHSVFSQLETMDNFPLPT